MSVHSTDNNENYVNQRGPFVCRDTTNQEIFKEFFSRKSKSQLKRENFNTHIIRTIIKVLDCLDAGQKPNCRLSFCFDVKDPDINRIWREIDLIYYSNIDYFTNKSELYQNRSNFKSMNLAFIKIFFEGLLIKNLYSVLIDLLFYYYRDKEILSKSLCLRCCTGNHREDCDEKWMKLKEYLKLHYLDDLKVI